MVNGDGEGTYAADWRDKDVMTGAQWLELQITSLSVVDKVLEAFAQQKIAQHYVRAALMIRNGVASYINPAINQN